MQNPVVTSSKMELCSLPPASSLLSTLGRRYNLTQRWRLFDKFDQTSNQMKYPGCQRLQLSQTRAQSSFGVTRFSASTIEATQKNADDTKDKDTVFVAGATGKVGSRTVRELLKLGFRVRAGVRSAQRAKSLVQSVREMKLETELTALENLELIECDLEKSNQILPALGTASVVICCIGASEKEIFDVTGPYRIDYQATKNLIDAASISKVGHFIIVTSLGTNKIGFPAAILNLFWGVLIWKRKAEEALIESGLPYTIVRPGGMERPTDSYKETHNLTLSEEDTLFGGQVSNLQVAELIAFMAQNRNLSYCKIVEAVAETTAPLTPMGELLEKIPSQREDLPKAEEQNAVTKRVDPEPAKSSVLEGSTDLTEENILQDKKVVPTALSPYTAYEDLKPPPSPSAPGSKEKQITTAGLEPSTSNTIVNSSEIDADTSKTATENVRQMRPLSPYAVYDDFKPPSSPSPPRKSGEISFGTPKTVDGVQQVTGRSLAENDPKEPAFYQSPLPIYDDLRPPASPTPAPPDSLAKNLTLADAESVTETDGSVDPVKEDQTSVESNPKPLSPYTMYEDMKPPASPMPPPKAH